MALRRIVLVGSKNPVKVEAVRRAFEQCAISGLHGLDYIGVSAPSGVNDQPMGDDETRQGSTNRANHCSSLIDKYGGTTKVAFCVGLEGGLKDAEGTHLFECFAWMAVYGTDSQRWSHARTASFVLPPRVCELVRGGMELGVADDVVFGRTNSKQEDGTVGILTKGRIDRTEYYRHALVLALVPFLQPDLYGEENREADFPKLRLDSKGQKGRFFLASGSKSRELVLKEHGCSFAVSPVLPDIDEKAVKKRDVISDASRTPLAIANAKMDALIDKVDGDVVVVCADTVIVGSDGEVIEKPQSVEEARARLSSYSDASVRVCTGVVAVDLRTGRRREGLDAATVHFEKLPSGLVDELVFRVPLPSAAITCGVN